MQFQTLLLATLATVAAAQSGAVSVQTQTSLSTAPTGVWNSTAPASPTGSGAVGTGGNSSGGAKPTGAEGAAGMVSYSGVLAGLMGVVGLAVAL